MFVVTISGNLVAEPKALYQNSYGDQMLGVRLGCTVFVPKKGEKPEKSTVWASGVVSQKKITGIMDRLTKGAFVVAHAPSAHLKSYVGQDGKTRTELALGYLNSLEASAPAIVQQANAAPQQVIPQQQAPVVHQQPVQQPAQQAAPPVQTLQSSAAPIQEDNGFADFF